MAVESNISYNTLTSFTGGWGRYGIICNDYIASTNISNNTITDFGKAFSTGYRYAPIYIETAQINDVTINNNVIKNVSNTVSNGGAINVSATSSLDRVTINNNKISGVTLYAGGGSGHGVIYVNNNQVNINGINSVNICNNEISDFGGLIGAGMSLRAINVNAYVNTNRVVIANNTIRSDRLYAAGIAVYGNTDVLSNVSISGNSIDLNYSGGTASNAFGNPIFLYAGNYFNSIAITGNSIHVGKADVIFIEFYWGVVYVTNYIAITGNTMWSPSQSVMVIDGRRMSNNCIASGNTARLYSSYASTYNMGSAVLYADGVGATYPLNVAV
jgi:hypothetical protein